MKNHFLRTITQIAFCFAFLLATSCGLKSFPSEYTFIKSGFEKVELDKLGKGQVLIYNGADILHKIDNTSRLNIWIDDKPLGQLRANQYVVVNLKKGKYKFKILHWDVVNMRSTAELEIDETTKVIRIKPTISSNKVIVTNELPKNFTKFRYTEGR
ncbi:MAG: hypothetical protein ABI441_02785 [Flavobacterium sp.]